MTYVLMNLNTTHQVNEFSFMIFKLMSCVQVDDMISDLDNSSCDLPSMSLMTRVYDLGSLSLITCDLPSMSL